MAMSRRDHLVETALDLFYRHGFHATGIDRILAASGVAKMTLYKHFGSKEDLILAVLRLRDERFRQWFRAAVESRARSPRKRLIAIFDVLEAWFSADGFQGDMFTHAAAEYGDPAHPIHAAAAEHKAAMRRYLQSLASAIRFPTARCAPLRAAFHSSSCDTATYPPVFVAPPAAFFA